MSGLDPVEIRTLTEEEAQKLDWVLMSARPRERIIGPAVIDRTGRRIGQLVLRLREPDPPPPPQREPPITYIPFLGTRR